MANKVRLLVLDVLGTSGNYGFYEKECEGLQDYYDALGCDCFDIANRNIGGKRFDIFVDDEGLFKEDLVPSVIDKSFKPMLVGNCVFANHDSEGNTTRLTDEDIEVIKSAAMVVADASGKRSMPWIVVQAGF